MVTCEFCNKNISNKYNLKIHQKTKTCMKHQGKKTNVKQCDCGKKFTSIRGYNNHQEVCLFNIKYNEKLKIEKKKHKKELEKQKEEYECKIKDLQDRIQELATKAIEKPTTNNTNILNLTPFNMEDSRIKDKIEEFYNLEYLRKGHRGVAEFTKDNLLMDDEGKLKYVCCDPSRSIFKYRDENGEVRKDVKANRLTKRITPDIVNKAHSIVTDEVSKLDGENANRNVEFYDMYFNLKELEKKPEKLGQELSKIVSQ